MKFWDASALVPLLAIQPATNEVRRIHEDDLEVGVWWGTELECASAIARLFREKAIDAGETASLWNQLAARARIWHQVQPTPEIRTTALRLLRTHALRAGDALQLAAAIVASDGIPSRLPFVCLDDRLRAAAEREGFTVLPS